MLVKNGCWWKTCMLVKNLHQHSPPKFHDVGENNVGEIVCWRKKICSFKIICMLVNYVGENFDVCWWKVFLLTKYVCWWKMLVKNVCWWKIYVGEIISLKYACWWKLFLYVGEKYVLEKILVFTNIQFHQHASPTLEQPTISWLDSKINGPKK